MIALRLSEARSPLLAEKWTKSPRNAEPAALNAHASPLRSFLPDVVCLRGSLERQEAVRQATFGSEVSGELDHAGRATPSLRSLSVSVPQGGGGSVMRKAEAPSQVQGDVHVSSFRLSADESTRFLQDYEVSSSRVLTETCQTSGNRRT